jgi:hypothetical protein
MRVALVESCADAEASFNGVRLISLNDERVKTTEN